MALKLKHEEKIKAEIESNSLKMREAINESSMLRTICERQERELKQRDSSSRSDGVRLTRQEEQITKLKIERQKLEETVAVSRCRDTKLKLCPIGFFFPLHTGFTRRIANSERTAPEARESEGQAN